MEPRALAASSGLAPWSQVGEWTFLCIHEFKIGGSRGAPLGLPPPLGERGGHPHKFDVVSLDDFTKAGCFVSSPGAWNEGD